MCWWCTIYVHKNPDKVKIIINRDYRLNQSPEWSTIDVGTNVCKYHIISDLTMTKC